MSEHDVAPDMQIGGAGFFDVLLVIGNDETFSSQLMSYALGIASRMGYSILAINLLDASPRMARYLTSSAGSQELETAQLKCERSVKLFHDMAMISGIKFDSEFHIGQLETVVKKIYKEKKNIDLALLEPDYLNEDVDGPISIPAFTMAPGSV